MSDAISIVRRKSEDEPSSFDSLRSEAIRLIEELTGSVWTDYNLHDPGITILEHLIYGITDAVHRTDFPVADLLTSEKGNIDYPYHALHDPLSVFPCRPLTEMDYRKQLIDSIDELDNVWLSPLPADGDTIMCDGLYHLLARLQPGLSKKEKKRVLKSVHIRYSQSRNLCEDIGKVSAVEITDYDLCARIEVDTKRNPADILAQVYFTCYQLMADTISSQDYLTALEQTDALEDVLDGPLTSQGVYPDEAFSAPINELTVAELFAKITDIEGINHIDELYLHRDGSNYYETISSDSIENALGLRLPESINEIKVELTKSGRALAVDVDELRVKFEENVYQRDRRSDAASHLNELTHLPTGVYRSISSYSSIQNDFPDKYGINTYGVPDSEADDVKARALQLKSYLSIYEQFLSNFMGNVEGIKTLFSLDVEQHQSYQFLSLEGSDVDKLALFYPCTKNDKIKQVSQDFDDYYERKSRVLDYLLALHGESFSQNSLRHFNYYYDKEEIDRVIVRNKVSYLSSIVEIGRDRASAPDYSARDWEKRAASGLQLKVNHLLGFENRSARSLTMAIAKHGIKLTTHDEYVHLKSGSGELRFLDLENTEQTERHRVFGIPPVVSRGKYHLKYLLKVLGDAIPFDNGLLSDMLLRGGINLERFRVVSLTGEQTFQLVYCTPDNQYWYLGRYDSKKEAYIAAHAMRELLVMMNKESEGFHLVEHVLLRPFSINQTLSDKEQEFYSFRASVVFPSWSARCHDRQFRKLAEETIRINAPAHILVDYYWLNFNAMYEFETLYEKWQEAKSQESPDIAALGALANKIADLLITYNQNNHDRRRSAQ